MKDFEKPVYEVGDTPRVRGTYEHGEVIFISTIGKEPVYVLRMYNGASGKRYLKKYYEHELILG